MLRQVQVAGGSLAAVCVRVVSAAACLSLLMALAPLQYSRLRYQAFSFYLPVPVGSTVDYST